MNPIEFPTHFYQLETEVAPSIRFYLPDETIPGHKIEMTIETHFPANVDELQYRAWVRMDMHGMKVIHSEGSINFTKGQPFDDVLQDLITKVNMDENFAAHLHRAIRTIHQNYPCNNDNTTLS